MAIFSQRPIADALEDLLEKERALLRVADFDRLSRLTDEKERLLKHIRRADLDIAQISRLKRSSARNEKLLLAATRGIKAARLGLDALRNQSRELRTYTQQGQSKDLTRRPSQLEKRS